MSDGVNRTAPPTAETQTPVYIALAMNLIERLHEVETIIPVYVAANQRFEAMDLIVAPKVRQLRQRRRRKSPVFHSFPNTISDLFSQRPPSARNMENST
jgi:hypothetical protein